MPVPEKMKESILDSPYNTRFDIITEKFILKLWGGAAKNSLPAVVGLQFNEYKQFHGGIYNRENINHLLNMRIIYPDWQWFSLTKDNSDGYLPDDCSGLKGYHSTVLISDVDDIYDFLCEKEGTNNCPKCAEQIYSDICMQCCIKKEDKKLCR